MSQQKYLGEFEQVVLLCLLHLQGEAYGAAIRQFLHARIQRDVALGALYATLERMEKKGLVSSSLGEATTQRGGRPKRFYTVTAKGQQALKATRQAQDAMWHGVSVKLQGAKA